MVKAPYNVLFDVNIIGDKNIKAKVENEYIYKDEYGPVSVSESGRHLAILGSLLLADKAEDKNYYLATGANIKRHQFASFPVTQNFNLSAELISLDKKKGEVYGQILNEENETIYEAFISYSVLKDSLFSRLFKKYRIENSLQPFVQNPYTTRRGFSEINVCSDKIEAVYGVIAPEDCQGHFQEFPALPVAIIANLFGELGVRLFLHNFPKFSKAYFTNAKLSAERLAFHGEFLTFRAEVVTKSTDVLDFRCEALINDKVIARGESQIKGI